MDEFLGRLGIQAVNYAMRCGIALTSTFAIQQCSRLLKTVENEPQYTELRTLQRVLDGKIKIVSPALDLIEFKSGRGNVFLGNAASLAKELHRDIVALGKRLENAAATEELAHGYLNAMNFTKEKRHVEISSIIHDIKSLLTRIDGDIPLLQLAITASGESLSTALPASISPSRLLQASMFLVIGDTQFSSAPFRPVQIGPSFTLSLYMLFIGHSSSRIPNSKPESVTKTTHDNLERTPYGIGPGERKPIWQEVLHKARVRICRTPSGWEFQHGRGFTPASSLAQEQESEIASTTLTQTMEANQSDKREYAYHIEIIEDLDDGRVHESTAGFTVYDGMPHTGVQEAIPIHQISKLFYTDSGCILNIGTENDLENTSVLLLKRDTTATSASKSRSQAGTEGEHNDEVSSDSSETLDEQVDVDRQIKEESLLAEISERKHHEGCTRDGSQHRPWQLPAHLDPDWLAFEAFVEDGTSQGDDVSDTDSETDNGDNGSSGKRETPIRASHIARASQDTHLLEQMHNMSFSGAVTPGPCPDLSTGNNASDTDRSPVPERAKTSTSQSPFGPVVTSLSLLEMLIRLTSLQQFQQTSHLSIPDHILTFFLEETSASGLKGEERWKAKRAAEQKMGFDPFTDTPSKTKKSK